MSYLLTPIAFGVHLWRGVGDRAHVAHLGERLGFGETVPAGGFWLHAVSVGEVKAAQPLIVELGRQHPARSITLTTATVTGRAEAVRLYADAVTVRYLPYDLPGATSRFLSAVHPAVAIILETELWPTLYRQCARSGVPIVLLSARLSERSVRRYARLGRLIRNTLQSITAIAAQTVVDAERFITLGAAADRTTVMGNLKFDVTLPEGLRAQGTALRATLGVERFIWVAGSTHEGEEPLLLDAHRQLSAHHGQSLLVLAPRHPQRFGEVAVLLRQRGIRFVARSTRAPVTPETEVLLLDTLGELNLFYAASDVAFVAGSWVPIGGHNVLEPAMLGRPVIVGPNVTTVRVAVDLLRAAGVLEVVDGVDALVRSLGAHASVPSSAQEVPARAEVVLAQNRGSTRRAMTLIDQALAMSLSGSRPSD